MSKGNVKWTIEEVRQVFRENNCKLISEDYKNNKTKLEYICECGNISNIAFDKFRAGQRCRRCSYIKTAEKKRSTIEELKTFYKSKGCILLSEEYVNDKCELEFICSCGKQDKSKLVNFKRSGRCRACGGNERYTLEEVKIIFESNNCTLLSEKYVNTKTHLDYMCHCGEKANTTLDSFLQCKRCYECRNKSISEKKKGILSNWYNPNLTDEERTEKRYNFEYSQWRKSIFERDDYTCKSCSSRGGKLNAHHLDGFHWCKERRYDISNGITLCEECHKEFHSTYGKKNNTEKQFKEFKKKRVTLT